MLAGYGWEYNRPGDLRPSLPSDGVVGAFFASQVHHVDRPPTQRAACRWACVALATVRTAGGWWRGAGNKWATVFARPGELV